MEVKESDTHFPWNHLCTPDSADPAVVTLVNFKGCSCQGNPEEQETGENDALGELSPGKVMNTENTFCFFFLMTKIFQVFIDQKTI